MATAVSSRTFLCFIFFCFFIMIICARVRATCHGCHGQAAALALAHSPSPRNAMPPHNQPPSLPHTVPGNGRWPATSAPGRDLAPGSSLRLRCLTLASSASTLDTRHWHSHHCSRHAPPPPDPPGYAPNRTRTIATATAVATALLLYRQRLCPALKCVDACSFVVVVAVVTAEKNRSASRDQILQILLIIVIVILTIIFINIIIIIIYWELLRFLLSK